ncbi:protein lifeguard 1-like isoform X2 [Bacillus rossius redtenbacheri]
MSWAPSAPAGYYPDKDQQGYYAGQPQYPPGVGQPPYPMNMGQPPYPPGTGQPPYPAGPGQPAYPGGYPSGPGYPPQYTATGVPPAAPAFTHSTNVGFASSPQAAMYGSSYSEDPGDQHMENFDFSDKTIRRGFIRKVYSILMVQLLITLAFVSLFTFHEPTKRFVHKHSEIWWVAFAVMLVTLIAMACCTNVRRKAPMNFIFLFLFTVAESFMLGAVASTYNGDAVMMAVGLTAAVCLGLTLFAFQTKWDFTGMGGILLVAVIILMIFGIVAMFVPGKTITLVYASLGALIFSIYLVYDTQLMMGGKHKYSVSPEEYIFAALNLYLDIVNIFIYILTIIGASRD